MPQSTTIKNAKALAISAAGQDVCGTTNSVDFTIERAVGEFFTACGDWARQLTGKRKWSGTINIFYSEIAGEGLATLMDAFDNDTEIQIIASPTGGLAGNYQWTGTVLLTSMPFAFNPSEAGPIMVAVPFVGQGELARAVVV